MRTYLKLLLLVGFSATQTLGAAPSVSAADLAVTRVKKASVRIIHRESRVIRDLDGTPIVIRARPVVLRGYDGTVLVSRQYDAYPVLRAYPSRYSNGEPVLPHYPRSWPRQFTRAYY